MISGAIKPLCLAIGGRRLKLVACSPPAQSVLFRSRRTGLAGRAGAACRRQLPVARHSSGRLVCWSRPAAWTSVASDFDVRKMGSLGSVLGAEGAGGGANCSARWAMRGMGAPVAPSRGQRWAAHPTQRGPVAALLSTRLSCLPSQRTATMMTKHPY